MRSLIAALVVIGLMFSVALAEGDTDAILLQCANDMAQIVTEKCSSEELISMYSGSSEITDLCSSWGGDWASEENRVRATVAHINDATLGLIFDALRIEGLLPEMSDDLMISMKSFIAGGPASILNGMFGTVVLAASSIANCSMVKSLEGIENGAALVLLDYGSEHPAILVSFIIGDNGATNVSAGIAMIEEDMKASIYELTDNMPGLAMMLEMLKQEQMNDLPIDISELMNGLHISTY